MLISVLTWAGCKKTIVDSWVRMVHESTYTLPYAEDVIDIQFNSSNFGVIRTSENHLFKSADQGASWIEMNVPTPGQIVKVEFLTDLIGFCQVGDNVYKTEDAGITWENSFTCIFFALTDEGKVTYAAEPFNATAKDVFVSLDTCDTWQYVGKISFGIQEEYMFSMGYLDNLLLGTSEAVSGLNLTTGDSYVPGIGNLTYAQDPQAFYGYGSYRAAVGTDGLVLESYGTSYMADFQFNEFDFNDVDGYQRTTIAVGNKAIISNHQFGFEDDEHWNYVLDEDLNAYAGNYLSIAFISSKTVLIGMADGKIIRCTI